MKKALLIIYSLFASLILLFALVFLGVNAGSEYSQGEARTKNQFEKLSGSVRQLTERNEINGAYIQRLSGLVQDEDDFAYLEIRVNGKPVLLLNGDADFDELEKSKFIKNYRKDFFASGNRVELKASMFTLRPSSIYFYARISFIIVLFITLLTIILILYHNFKHRKDYLTEEIDRQIDESISRSSQEPGLSETRSTETAPQADKSKEEEPSEKKAASVLTETEERPYERVELPTEDIKPSAMPGGDEKEKLLFSPITGLGWESNFLPRLSNELNRSTASETDLALYLMKFPQIRRDSELMKDLSTLIVSKFQFNDLVFEYKENSIAGITLSRNIDEAMAFAEELCAEIKERLGEDKKYYMGITARGIRMLSGERLLKEAEEALHHAEEDAGSSIIAFRADADKYREFMEKA